MSRLPWIRWFLTVVLLVVVFFHAHWSVGLAITLLSVANELNEVFFFQELRKVLKHEQASPIRK